MFRVAGPRKTMPKATDVEARRRHEVPIAMVKGGPWEGRVIWLNTAENHDTSAELFEGVSCPVGSEFVPLPTSTPEMRDVVYISGPSGTGKSTAAAMLAATLIDTYTNQKTGEKPRVIIVCPDDPAESKAFNDLDDFIWLTPEELVEEQPTLQMLRSEDTHMPTLVIFDDIEGLSDKKQAKALETFSQMVLERGRKSGIFVYFISHRPASGKMTKVILQEQNAIWFPVVGATAGNLTYCLKTYMGMPPEFGTALKRGAKEFGRWVLVKTDAAPKYAITPKKIFLIDEEAIKATVKHNSKVRAKDILQELKDSQSLDSAEADDELESY